MRTTPTPTVADVPEDRDLSPFTGWTRSHLETLADQLLLSLRPWAGESGSTFLLPGHRGDEPIAGLEAFARSFMIAAFRLAGAEGHDPHGFGPWYAEGLRTGTDPSSPHRWPRPDEHPQAKVEAAALVLGLHMTRPWLWDDLSDDVRQQVIDYLSPAIGLRGPQNNWVWFRIMVEQFLASVGGPSSDTDLADDLAMHESFYRGGGWYADGADRAFDHYGGWALHLYPLLWTTIPGARDASDHRQRFAGRLDRFLDDALLLVGADGGPLIQGRSLTYRFGAAAPFWMGAWHPSTSHDLGALRRAASGIVKHFATRGVPNERGLLDIGWFGPSSAITQDYSTAGSPYWAAKGLLGLALPAHHPMWSAPEQPLPGERGDRAAIIDAPGWLVSATRADGLVRIANHGTDGASPEKVHVDSPWYDRIGYSTATFPLQAGSPLPDQSVVFVDDDGRPTARAGLEPVSTGLELDGASAQFSRCTPMWVTADADQPDHGPGRPGSGVEAATITVGSVLRGAWEVRLVRVDRLAPREGAPAALRVTGWALSGDDVSMSGSRVECGDLRTRLVPLTGLIESGTLVDPSSTPLGERSALPWAGHPNPAIGGWYAAAVELARESLPAEEPPSLQVNDGTASIRWADGRHTQVVLP